MSKTVQTAVVGVTGYAGAELARLLLHHPRLKGTPPVFAGRMDAKDEARGGVPLSEIHPQLAAGKGSRSLKLEPFSWDLLTSRGVEVLFLATPHEQSREWTPEALERGMRVIDLSGAWRLTEAANRAVYNFDDDGTELAEAVQAQAVYGMPELHRAAIATARLVANPGCYATSVILALKPLVAAGLVDLDHGIVADSKSGVSGAGKAPTAKTHFMYAADNLSAYGVFTHRHTGELLEQIGVDKSQIVFTPHLLPIPRGILSTIYVHFGSTQTVERISSVYHDFFSGSPMVRLYDKALPQIRIFGAHARGSRCPSRASCASRAGDAGAGRSRGAGRGASRSARAGRAGNSVCAIQSVGPRRAGGSRSALRSVAAGRPKLALGHEETPRKPMAARSRCYCWSRYRRSLRNRPHRRPDNSPSSSKFPTRSFPPRPASLSRRWLPVRPLRLEHRCAPASPGVPLRPVLAGGPLGSGRSVLARCALRTGRPGGACRPLGAAAGADNKSQVRVKRGPGARDTSSDVGVSRYADRSSFSNHAKAEQLIACRSRCSDLVFAFSAHGPAADAATLARPAPHRRLRSQLERGRGLE